MAGGTAVRWGVHRCRAHFVPLVELELRLLVLPDAADEGEENEGRGCHRLSPGVDDTS